MSAFYGQVIGQAGTAATRRGSAASGITATVQSWNGSLISEMSYDGDDVMVRLQISDGSSAFGRTVFYGTLQELEKKLEKS